MATPRRQVTGKDLNLYRREAAFVLAVRGVSYANPKAWMLAVATAGSFMASNATIARIAIIVIVFSIAAMASIITWAWLGATLRNWLSVGSRMKL